MRIACHFMRKEALSHSLEVTSDKWMHREFGRVQHQTARNVGKDQWGGQVL